MKDEEHPYYLNRSNEMHKATNRLAGFIGGGVFGLVIGIIGVVIFLKLGFLPRGLVFYGIIGSTVLFSIVGAVRPKWFAWIIEFLTFFTIW